MHATSEMPSLDDEAQRHDCAFRTIVDNMHDMATLVDAAGGILFTNRRKASSSLAIPGNGHQSFFDLVHPEDVPAVRDALSTTLASGMGTVILHRCRRRDGGWCELESALSRCQHTETGAAAIIVSRDITERRMEDELRRDEHTLHGASQLSGAIANDVGELLLRVGRHVDILEGVQSAAVRAEARSMRAALDGAWVVIGQLQSFGRLEDTGPTVSVDAQEVVTQSARHLEQLAGSRVELLYLLGASSALVRMPRASLEHLLAILVRRACEAMPKGGAVSLSVSDSRPVFEHAPPRGVVLEFVDTGMPLTAQDTTLLETGEGTGDGNPDLARVFSIVDKAGGMVIVHSSEPTGTAIRILLPVTA